MRAKPPLKIVLCSPRGFCAGVVARDRHRRTGAQELWRAGLCAPRDRPQPLCRGGAEGQGRGVRRGTRRDPRRRAPVIFSAHGVPKRCRPRRERAISSAIDATCPLVTKVHREAEMPFQAAAAQIVLIGHAGHPEVVGTHGPVAGGRDHADRDGRGRRGLRADASRNLAFVTQTTLSVDDTAAIVAALKERLPARSPAPHKEDICYATTNRQEAVKASRRGRCADRDRRAQFLQFAAAARSRASATAAASPCWCSGPATSTGRAGRHQPRSASPPAPRRPKCWSRRSSPRSPSATTSASRRCPRRKRRMFFQLPRTLRSGDEPLTNRRDAGRWRSTPKSPTRSLPHFIALRHRRRCSSDKGIAEGVENTNFLLHTEHGLFHPDALREAGARRRSAVLPGADGASGGARRHLPAAGAQTATASRWAGSPAGRPRSSPFSTASRSSGPRRTLRRASARRSPSMHLAGRRFPDDAAQRSLGRRLARRCSMRRRARRRGRAGPCARASRPSLRRSNGDLAAGPAAGRHPRRSLPRQCLLPRRAAFRADRLLLRLHRHPRLRRRRLSQRLVLRAGRLASTSPRARALLAGYRASGRSSTPESAALPILAAAPPCASC